MILPGLLSVLILGMASLVDAQTCPDMLMIEKPANVILGGLFDIHTKGPVDGDGMECGSEINEEGMQRLEAFLFAINEVNAKGIIPGVNLGGMIYDTCESKNMALKRTLNYLARREGNQVDMCDFWPAHLGVVGPFSSEASIEVASLLTSSKVTQIGYSARAGELSNSEKYPYYVRVVPEGNTVAKVIADLLKMLKWYDVAIVTGSDPHDEELLQELLGKAGGEGLCIMEVIHLNTTKETYEDIIFDLRGVYRKGVRGVILLTTPHVTERFFMTLQNFYSTMEEMRDFQWILSHPFRESSQFDTPKVSRYIKGLIAIEEYSGDAGNFRNHFLGLDAPRSNSENPWFNLYWEQVNNCNLSQNCTPTVKADHAGKYEQAVYVSQVIASVYTYAHALKAAHKDLCQQSGTCPALGAIDVDTLSKYLKSTEFINVDQEVVRFDKDGNLAIPKYSITNLQMSGSNYINKKVGTWTEIEGLDMESDAPFKMYNRNGDILSSYPTSRCYNCNCDNKLYDNSYGYEEEGDIMIAGVFDIHSSYNGHFGIECNFGQIDETGMQALEAFYYALDQVNRDSDILPGLKLSGLVFDSCRNPNRAVRQLKEVVTGDIKIYGRNKEETLAVDAVIGGMSSDVSMAIADFLSVHKIPQVSYGSGSAKLSDKTQYPYFLRTVGSDTAQTKAIIDILKKFDWHYVTVIYSSNAYGRSAFDDFMVQAEREGICIATQVKIEPYFANDPDAMKSVVSHHILDGFHNSTVAVLLTTDTDARAILNATQEQMQSHSKRLVWVASDYWGSRPQVVKDLEQVAEGAITLGFYAEEVGSFMRYFQTLKRTSSRDPWFEEYWQRHFQCHINSVFKNKYPNRCQSRLTLETQNIKMADEVPYVIDSVYAVAVALHNMIIDVCGVVTVPICTQAKQNMEKLSDYLEVTDFYNGLTKLNVTFDVLGNGPPRYNVFNFQRDENSKLDYTKVGTWIDHNLTIQDDKIQSFADSKGNPIPATSVASQCVACPCSTKETTGLKFQIDYKDLILPGYFPIHSSPGGAKCSKFRSDVGFIDYMAFKYAIDMINNDSALLPGVTLGYIAFDTCSDRTQAEQVFKATTDRLRLFSQPRQTPRLTYAQAFVGSFEDDVTIGLNKLNSESYQWVHISPGAQRLNTESYPYFLRSAPAEDAEAHALVSAIRSLGWTYISIVVSDSERAIKMKETLSTALEDQDVCVATSASITEDPSALTEYNAVIDQLMEAKGAIGVILLAEPKGVVNFMEVAARRSDVKGRLIWLGTSLWANVWDELSPFIDLLRGAIMVFPDIGNSPGFDQYMRRQNLLSDDNNPWFRKFWQNYFQCNLEYNAGYTKPCTGKEHLTKATFSNRQSVISTINAVYSYAKGLTNMFTDLCGNMNLPPCQNTKGKNSAEVSYKYMKEATLEAGADGKPFAYSSDGSGPGRYKVLNIQIPGRANRWQNGMIEIGNWVSGYLTINKSMVRMYNKEGEMVLPRSSCPGICNCSMKQPYLDTENVPVKFTAHRYIWGVIVLTFAMIGIVFAFVIMFFFIFKFKHPVVMVSTCSLSVMLLFGIILLYLLNFAFMTSATKVTCGLRRLCLGTFYAIIYSCLLVKAIRVARMTNKANLACKIPFVSGPSQSCFAFILVSIQVLIAVEWLILDPPDVQHYKTNIMEEGEFPIYAIDWECRHTDNALVTSLFYVFLLVLLTLIISMKCVASSEMQYEAAYLALTSFLTVLILVSWICVYAIASRFYQAPAVCIGITVNASVVLLFMFAPKMVMLTASKPTTDDAPTSNGIDNDGQYAISNRRANKTDSGRRRVAGEHAITVVSGRYQVNSEYPYPDGSYPHSPPTPEA